MSDESKGVITRWLECRECGASFWLPCMHGYGEWRTVLGFEAQSPQAESAQPDPTNPSPTPHKPSSAQ